MDELLKFRDIGSTVAILLFLWRALGKVLDLGKDLTEKWAARFLDTHTKQAEAMATLADTVRQSHTDSREILIAIRVLSRQMDDMKAQIEGIK